LTIEHDGHEGTQRKTFVTFVSFVFREVSQREGTMKVELREMNMNDYDKVYVLWKDS